MAEPIKRIPLKELKETCREIFYNQLASEGHIIKCMSSKNKDTKKKQTVADFIHEAYLYEVKLTEMKLELYEETLEKKETIDYKKELLEQQALLQHYKEVLPNSSFENQKIESETNKSTMFSRTKVMFPLDKLINSYYDDYALEVVYYDDVSTLKGKYNDYKKLKTKKGKVEFIKANTEITHMGLCIINGDNHYATIVLEGNVKEDNFTEGEMFPQINGIYCLPSKFADFTTLTLKDTLKIDWNNDLQQNFQSKIDLDKEGLEVKADKFICEDNYKILTYKQNDKGYNFIRYICPSTGRVYFNHLNLENLKISKFYKDNDYDSYIDAWWNITHVGADPYEDISTRC